MRFESATTVGTRKATDQSPVAPVPAEVERPFWSVMIPAYEPGEWLEAALRSVLDQDEGRERMQIAVVDDASPTVDVATLVRRLAGDRVEYHRNPTNLRLAGNWNRAVEVSRGQWVHLLHQDDLVHPGFYTRMAAADVASPDVGAAFCRHAFIDAEGHTTHVAKLEQSDAGRLHDALGLLSRNQIIQCPAIVVRRRVYETLGGFRVDLKYTLDWEMWTRIASAYAFWYEPRTLASYRTHQNNESARLRHNNALEDDIFRTIEIVRNRLPESLRADVGREILNWQRDENLIESNHLMRAGHTRAALAQFRRAARFDPSLRRSRIWIHYYYWAWKTRLSRLLHNHPARHATSSTSGS